MCKKMCLLASIVLFLGLSGNVRAADAIWTGAGVGNDWSTGANWDTGSPPLITERAVLGMANETVEVTTAVACDRISGPGHQAPGTGPMDINVQSGGSVTFTDLWAIGYLSTGVVNIAGTVNSNGIRCELGGSYNTSDGTVNMTGGTWNIKSLQIPRISKQTELMHGKGHLQLDSGTVNVLAADGLRIRGLAPATYENPATPGYSWGEGTMDITGGVMYIAGDAAARMKQYTADGWLTGYGTPGNVYVDYLEGEDRTIVRTPIPEPATIALLGLGGLMLQRRRTGGN